MGFSIGKVVKTVTKPFNPQTYLKPENLLDQIKGSGGSSAVGSGALTAAATGNPYLGIVQGAVGLGQDLLSGWWNTRQQQKLNDKAYAQNVALWNMQNAYNDPSAQMERLQRAGLNPNLVYGGGNVTGNTTSNYPTYEPVKYSGIGSFLTRNQQKQIAMAQLDLGMKEFQQRVTNQSINNAIAIEKLQMYSKINDAMLGNYRETTRSKKLMNDFFENPIENVDTSNGINLLMNLMKLFVRR